MLSILLSDIFGLSQFARILVRSDNIGYKLLTVSTNKIEKLFQKLEKFHIILPVF